MSRLSSPTAKIGDSAPRVCSSLGVEETKAELAVPLLSQNGLIGVLNVESSRVVAAFGEPEKAALKQLAAAGVIAINLDQVNLRKLESIRRVSETIKGLDSEEKIIQAVLQEIVITSRSRYAGTFPRSLGGVREVESSFRKACDRGRSGSSTTRSRTITSICSWRRSGAKALGRGMKSIAARFARAVNRALKRSGPVLARPLPLQRAPDADPGAERAALRAAERAAPLGEEPAAAREGRGQDHARVRAARARRSRRRRGGSTAGRGTSRSTAHRRPARWRRRRPGSSRSAGGAGAGSSTRTRSRAACAPDGRPAGPPARPRSAPPTPAEAPKRGAARNQVHRPRPPPTPTPPKPSDSGPRPVRSGSGRDQVRTGPRASRRP